MSNSEENNIYLCIDLKSFFASVECADRGLDPFCTNLAVADPSRGRGGICLAITPAMKELGIKNRCRVFEIPPHIDYITAKPRMKRYMEISAKIYSVYLKYIAPEDIHVYSIDECFIYISPYFQLYKKNPREMAIMLMEAVFRETKICATAGIGTNLFLAKIALDITAKHVPDHIGYLDQETFRQTIWHHKPITDIWSIGKGIANRLLKYNVTDLYGVAHMDTKKLYKEFGQNAEFLIDHSWGIEPCTIEDIHAYKPETSSISNGQVLGKAYDRENGLLLIKEMLEMLVLELVDRHMMCKGIGLCISYENHVRNHTGGSRKLSAYTSSYHQLVAEFEKLYRETTAYLPIKKLSVSLEHVIPEDNVVMEMDLFEAPQDNTKERKMHEAMLAIKHKFGKNSVIRGMSLLDKATGRERNRLVGGHNGE